MRLVRRGRVVLPARGAALTRRAALLQALGFAGGASAVIAGLSVRFRGPAPAPAAGPTAAAGEAVGDAAALAPGDALSVLRTDGSSAWRGRRAEGVRRGLHAPGL